MKLVELLARELKEWPEGTKCMAQNSEASVVMLKSLDVIYRNEIWVGADGVSIVGFRNLSELATDHATAIVTRADWEAEKARIAGKVDGGWIRNKRKSQPVSDGAIVEIRTRGGEYETCEASCFSWGATGKSQIMAYRIHKPAEQPAIEPAVVENVQAFNAQAELLYDPVAQGPLQWRDRIYELDTQRAELEATYQRQIGEIDGERDGLVGKLKAEGFSLIEQINAGLADAKQAHDGMDDWRSWKAGDLVECCTSRWPGVYASGDKYAVIEVNPLRIADDYGGEDSSCLISEENAGHFKWHSRPAS